MGHHSWATLLVVTPARFMSSITRNHPFTYVFYTVYKDYFCFTYGKHLSNELSILFRPTCTINIVFTLFNKLVVRNDYENWFCMNE